MPLKLYRVASRLKRDGWQPLLKQWGSLMDRWCGACRRDGDDRDVPYWYGERALTGLLAAAAWRRPNGYALEEFGTIRRLRKASSKGRIDPYIVLKNTWYQIEAKQTWPADNSTDSLDRAIESAGRALSKAGRQLRSVHKDYYGDWGLALCYVVPEVVWRKKEPRPPQPRLLTGLAEHFRGKRFPIVALYAPPRVQEPWVLDGKGGRKRYYPGLLLVGKSRRDPRRH